MQPASFARPLISSCPSRFVRNPSVLPEGAEEVFSRFRDKELCAYLNRTPSARMILSTVGALKGRIVNDHVALRTLQDRNGMGGLALLEKIFLSFGYQREDKIRIPELHLKCRWYEPPEACNWPKVFISEQQVSELPKEAQDIVHEVVKYYYSNDPLTFLKEKEISQIDPKQLFDLLEHPPWNPSYEQYTKLIEIAKTHTNSSAALQYTAWTLVHAHRWNHFTVLLNELDQEQFPELETLNNFLKREGFALNSWNGSEVQGSADKFLKQSSTKADLCKHYFSCGTEAQVPGSFVEFIQRFHFPDGQPMRGFLVLCK